MNCAVCRGPDGERWRREWGCDVDAETVHLELGCLLCHGVGCEDCTDGRWQLRRCPRATVDWLAAETCRLATMLEAGIMPVAGGALDQSATFVDAAGIVLGERGRYRDQEMRRHGAKHA